MKYSDRKIQLFELTIVTTVLCLFQAAPIVALSLVKARWAKLLIAITMIVLMSTINVLFADAAKTSNFAGVAAYVPFGAT